MFSSEKFIEDKVLHLVIEGEINLLDVLKEVAEAYELWTFKEDVNFFVDLSNVFVLGTFDDVFKLNEMNKSVIMDLPNIKCAVLTKDITSTSLASLFQEISKSESFDYKIFSYKLAGLSWLKKLD